MGSDGCAHPWLRVTCGECGAPIDELRPEGTSEAMVHRADPTSPEGPKKLFIVARGHPELVEQLKAVMGDSETVQVIEDRRRASRDPSPPSTVRTELRRKILEDESNL